MPVLSPDRLARSLSEGARGGVFFLHGDETFLKEEACDAIVAAHLDPATRDFNLDQLRGTEVSVERLASILQTPPMMAEWRVVVVREAQAFANSARARAVIEDALARTIDGLVFILIADIPERSRAKFYEQLKREAISVEFAPLAVGDVPGWLMTRARAEGLELEADAARALAAAIGSEMGILASELAKLRDYVGDRRRIETADIEAVVGSVPRQNRWDWFDLVGGGEFARARAALPVLLDSGENGVGLVIGLGTQLLRIALVLHGGERALQAELPRHQQFLAGRIARQARSWTPATADAALEDLLRADRLLKSTNLGDQAILDELLLRLQARAQTVRAA